MSNNKTGNGKKQEKVPTAPAKDFALTPKQELKLRLFEMLFNHYKSEATVFAVTGNIMNWLLNEND